MEHEMNDRDLHAFRRQLQELTTRVRTDAAALAEQTHSPSGGNGGSELSNAPFHLGDMGTEEYLYDMNATLLENEQYIVSEARESLRRMDEGKYGKCEQCGRAIASRASKRFPTPVFALSALN